MAVLSSVDSYIDAQPEEVMDFNTFYNTYGRGKYGNSWNDADPDHWTAKFANFFTGDVNKARNLYDAYLTNVNNRNEFKSAQSARAWDKMMDDTKYQRQMKDIAAAGLNPYLLVNNGGISASAAPTGAKADYEKVSRRKQEKSDNGRNVALLVLALAKVAAALL